MISSKKLRTIKVTSKAIKVKAINRSGRNMLNKVPSSLRRKKSNPITFKIKKPLSDEQEYNEEIVTESSIIENQNNTQRISISHYNFKTRFHKQLAIPYKTVKKPFMPIKELIISKEGILSKKSSSLLRAWRDRKCKLEDQQFLIYKKPETGLLLGVIDFRRFPVTLSKCLSSLTFT